MTQAEEIKALKAWRREAKKALRKLVGVMRLGETNGVASDVFEDAIKHAEKLGSRGLWAWHKI